MIESAVVHARIDAATKTAAVLAAMGLSLSDAFRLLLKRVTAEKALPFEPLVPNPETVAAMKAAHRGDLVTAGEPASLLASLNADCLNIRAVSSKTTGGRNQGSMARSWILS